MKFDGYLRVYRWKNEQAKVGWKKAVSSFTKLVKLSDKITGLDVLVCELDQYASRQHVLRIDGIDYDYGISIFTSQDIEDFLVELPRSEMVKYI